MKTPKAGKKSNRPPLVTVRDSTVGREGGCNVCRRDAYLPNKRPDDSAPIRIIEISSSQIQKCSFMVRYCPDCEGRFYAEIAAIAAERGNDDKTPA